MGFFDNFPYTNFHQLNLDWLVKSFNELKKYVEEYTAVNNVSYAGVWDITKQYPQWAIVSNGDKTYMAKQAVPYGIPIDNDNYWIHLADLDPRIGAIINKIESLEDRLDVFAEELFKSILDLSKFNGEDLSEHYDGNFRGLIILPESCKLSNTITVNEPCILFGINSIVNSSNPECFNVNAENCVIKSVNFNYVGKVVDPDTANNSVIHLYGDNCDIENCIFTNFPSAAVSVHAKNTEINNCVIDHMTSSVIAAIWCGPKCKECYITGCSITNNYLDGAHVEGRNVTFHSCTITNNGIRPSLVSKALGACGIYGGRTESDRPIEIVVDSCAISNNSEAGIDLGSSGGRFVNNVFYHNALNGIYFGSNYRNIITGNTFTENGWYAGDVEKQRKSSIGSSGPIYGVIINGNSMRAYNNELDYVNFPVEAGNNQLISNNICENGKGFTTVTDSSVMIVNNISV